MPSKVWCVSCSELFVLSIVERQNTKHVALVGVTGVGKSTLVNVLVDSYHAKVNNDAEPCTTERESYNTEFGGTRFTLWDTRGLNEPREKEVTSPLARFRRIFRMRPSEDRELQTFLRGNNPAINIVLFCIEAKDIRGRSQWKSYGKVYKKFCKKKVKIVVVVTKLDEKTHGIDWKNTCMLKAREVARGSPGSEGSIEAVPELHQKPEDMRDCQCRDDILRLLSSSI